MTIPFSAAVIRTSLVVVVVVVVVLLPSAAAVGSAATLAISSAAVCGVLAGPSLSSVSCSRFSALTPSPPFSLSPIAAFSSVAGGRNFFCGLRSGGRSLFCWNFDANGSNSTRQKRVYKGDPVTSLTVGDDHVAAVQGDGKGIVFWRQDATFPRQYNGVFRSLTSGRGFSCAIDGNSSVRCWGGREYHIEAAFVNISMATIVAGESHVCGFTTGGNLVCKGSNNSGQLEAPEGSALEFASLALGANHSCAIRRDTNTAVCWGGVGGKGAYFPVGNRTFEFIVAGGELTCGVTSANLSVVCWMANRNNPAITVIPLPKILPGVCIADESSCSCAADTNSQSLCSGAGFICKHCPSKTTPSPPVDSPSPSPPSPSPTSTARKKSKWNYVFVVIGAVGGFAGLCTILYLLFTCICRRKKVHNSVQPTIASARNGGGGGSAPVAPGAAITSPFTSPSSSRSNIFRRQASRVFRRQRSGPSSMKDRAEQFTLAELADATKNFSLENKIGSGSFGTVYKGKLPDGREVAIKRSESGPKTKKFQEKESAFQSELAFLSRLNHKHLVGLVGYCEEKEERLLVYEYMKNGALYDHLHAKKDGTSDASVLDSWKLRIKILLDAARGIEYLHNYAVPPIIHRDIKSSNILLDGNWTARVSDFGLSLMGPETDGEHLSMKAAGTVGYMDPEYYGLHHLTVKSDVYGFGVVMLEVLTGKKAIFKDVDSGSPTSVVDYALASIAAGEVGRVLDARVAPPGAAEAEALELVAYTAVHCVSLEGRERPTMTDIIANLDGALAMCEGSHVSISSASLRSSD